MVVKENTDYDQNSACVEYKQMNGTAIENRFDAQILLFDRYVAKDLLLFIIDMIDKTEPHKLIGVGNCIIERKWC